MANNCYLEYLLKANTERAFGKLDLATPYIRQLLSFIGITDLEIIAANSVMSDLKQIDRAIE
jgi:FMN-dependent NADH-azoreductase